MIHYPHDLAACVREQWDAAAPSVGVAQPERRATAPPDAGSLEALLSTAYQASLLREEGRPVVFRMLLGEPDEFPSAGGPPGGLHRLLFSEARPLDAAELRRLSPAVAFHRTLIGVRGDGPDRFSMWGLLHAGRRWLHPALRGRATTAGLPSSALVVSVTGPGLIAVMRGDVALCELRAGSISCASIDVFGSSWLTDAFEGLRSELAALHVEAPTRARSSWASLEPKVIGAVAPQMLKQLVASIRRAHHGGMLIVVPAAAATTSDAGVYRIKYAFKDEEPRRRYRTLVVAAMRAHAAANARMAADREQAGAPEGPIDPRVLAADEALVELSSLIATLANVDGAVVVTDRLELLGFGCEIAGGSEDVSRVRKSLDPEGERWVEETTETVGTRHRAAYRLCQSRHDTIAIVVSQDGPVRFVRWKNGGVMVWDQILDWPEV